MEDENRISYFFLGLGLGVAVGVLFAPKSGDETREMIRNKANEGADYMKRRSAEFKDQASDAIDRSKQTLQKHKDNLSAAMDAGRQAYRDAVNTPPNSPLNNARE